MIFSAAIPRTTRTTRLLSTTRARLHAFILAATLAVYLGFAACAGVGNVGTVFAASKEGVLTVGSKRFTESYILAELIRQTAIRAGESGVVRRSGQAGRS